MSLMEPLRHCVNELSAVTKKAAGPGRPVSPGSGSSPTPHEERNVLYSECARDLSSYRHTHAHAQSKTKFLFNTQSLYEVNTTTRPRCVARCRTRAPMWERERESGHWRLLFRRNVYGTAEHACGLHPYSRPSFQPDFFPGNLRVLPPNRDKWRRSFTRGRSVNAAVCGAQTGAVFLSWNPFTVCFLYCVTIKRIWMHLG